MIELFTLEGIQKKAAVFDTTKLEWMNGQYLSALPAEELLGPVERQLARMGMVCGPRPGPDHRRGEGPLANHPPRGRAGGGAPRSRPGAARRQGRGVDAKARPRISEQSPARRRRARERTDAGLDQRAPAGGPEGRRGDARSQAGRRDAADPGGAHRVDGFGTGERAAGRGRAARGASAVFARLPTAEIHRQACARDSRAERLRQAAASRSGSHPRRHHDAQARRASRPEGSARTEGPALLPRSPRFHGRHQPRHPHPSGRGAARQRARTVRRRARVSRRRSRRGQLRGRAGRLRDVVQVRVRRASESAGASRIRRRHRSPTRGARRPSRRCDASAMPS